MSALVFLLAGSLSRAEIPTSDNLAPEVVLVLKLVSRSDIQPTTGVVITASGDVLIPSGFTDGTEELLVLDGGSDLVRHGRKATLLINSPAQGLAMINVEGLSRPAVSIGTNALPDGSELTYAAFQPAEELLQGMPPFFGPVTIDVNDAVNIRGISPDTPIPNLAGVLLDHCGNLRGLSIPDGEPSLGATTPTVVIFEREVLQFLNAHQYSPPLVECEPSLAEVVTNTEEVIADDPPAPEAIVEKPEPAAQIEDPSEEVQAEAEAPVTEIIREEQKRPGKWPFFGLGAVILIGLLWGFRAIIRKRNQVSSDDRANSSQNFKPRGAADLDVQAQPDMNSFPPEVDGLLLVEAILPDGTELVRYQPVNTQKSRVVIGNGSAGLQLDHPSLAAEHAVISFANNELILGSITSESATWVGQASCHKDEVFILGKDEIVVLGEVSCRVRLNLRSAQAS